MKSHESFSTFTADLRQFMCDSLRPGAGEGTCLEEAFNSLAMRLFALQFSANTPYRQLCLSAGVEPGSISSWRAIPAFPAAGFKEFPATCLPRENRTHTFFSSGTSRSGSSRHFHCRESLDLYEASLWPWFQRHLLPDMKELTRLSLIVLTPEPAAAPNSSLAHMFEVVRSRLGRSESVFAGAACEDGSWTISFDRVQGLVEAAQNDGVPALVLGTAFSFVHLLDEMKRRGVEFLLHPGSRVMETGGYKGRSRILTKPELHKEIQLRFGVSANAVVSEYGMSELSSQGYDATAFSAKDEQDESRRYHFPPWARAQIISPESGTEAEQGIAGLIRVLDLANVYSVMHLQTEDLGRGGARGFELIGRAAAAEPRGCSLMMGEG